MSEADLSRANGSCFGAYGIGEKVKFSLTIDGDGNPTIKCPKRDDNDGSCGNTGNTSDGACIYNILRHSNVAVTNNAVSSRHTGQVVLNHIGRNPGTSVEAIAQAIGTVVQTVRGPVQQLVKRGKAKYDTPPVKEGLPLPEDAVRLTRRPRR